MMLLIWNGMVVVVIVVRSRQPQEIFGGKNHQTELSDFSLISHTWEMGEEEESGMNPNLVHTLRLRVTKEKKILEMGSHEDTLGHIKAEVSLTKREEGK